MGRDSAAGDTPSTTLVRAIKRIVGAQLQVISSDLFMSGNKGAILALLLTETTLGCHVLLHSSSPFLVPTCVAALHHLIRAAVVRGEVVLYCRQLHLLATGVGAMHKKVVDITVSSSVLKDRERALRLLCAPASRAGVGSGLPHLDAS